MKPRLHDRAAVTRDQKLESWRAWAGRHDRGQVVRRNPPRSGTDIIARLEALPPDAPYTAVEEATGDDYSVRCDACACWVEVAVTVGEEPDYDSSTATICRPCLVQALAAFGDRR